MGADLARRGVAYGVGAHATLFVAAAIANAEFAMVSLSLIIFYQVAFVLSCAAVVYGQEARRAPVQAADAPPVRAHFVAILLGLLSLPSAVLCFALWAQLLS